MRYPMIEQSQRRLDHIYLLYRFLVFGAVLCITIIGFVSEYAWRWVTRQGCSWQALLGRWLARLCESLGTTYIKIGQLLSTRYDIIPPAILEPLERLQDRVAPFDPGQVPAILARQLGCPPAEVFKRFEPQPRSEEHTSELQSHVNLV